MSIDDVVESMIDKFSEVMATISGKVRLFNQ